MDGILDPHAVFDKTMAASSEANRFRYPSVPPGERALELEGQVLRLERLLSDRVTGALERANLTCAEREAVVAKVLAFLSDRRVAERLGTPKPDADAFRAEVDGMLERFDASPEARAEVIHEIERALDATKHRRAA